MDLYIRIENGQPVNHPALKENLVHAFGCVPSSWVPFTRIEQPAELLTSPFQIAVNTYTMSLDGTSCSDNWSAIEMTELEKNSLISTTQANPPGPNITLDVNTLQWIANIPEPTDGKKYYWSYPLGDWVTYSSEILE